MTGSASAAIDAHQHIWDPARAQYPWTTPELDRLRRPFDHADVVAEQAEVDHLGKPPIRARG